MNNSNLTFSSLAKLKKNGKAKIKSMDEAIRMQVAEMNKRYTSARQEVEQLKDAKEDLEEAAKELEEAEQKVEALEKEKESLSKQIDKLEQDLKVRWRRDIISFNKGVIN